METKPFKGVAKLIFNMPVPKLVNKPSVFTSPAIMKPVADIMPTNSHNGMAPGDCIAAPISSSLSILLYKFMKTRLMCPDIPLFNPWFTIPYNGGMKARIVPGHCPEMKMVKMAQDFSIQDAARKLGRDDGRAFDRRKPGYGKTATTARFEDDGANGPAGQQKSPSTSSSFSRIVLVTAFILLVMSLLLLGIARYLGTEIAQGGHTFNTSPVEIVIGNNVLDVPANLIRFAYQRRSGDHEKLDLYMHWPDLSGYNEDLARDFNDLEDMSRIIFLTLEPRLMAYDMSGRIKPIYERYFVGSEESIGHGLVRRKLNGDAGFLDEYLAYETESPYPFSARCVEEGSTIGAPICIRDIQIGENLTLTYRFHSSYLADWLRMDQSIRSRIQRLIVSN